jgi:DNA-binding XRE family transcriptional regulator
MDNPKTEQTQRDETDVKQSDQTKKATNDTSNDSAAQSKKKKGSVRAKPQRKNNVKKFRMERMMSKAELARRAHLSSLTIDRVEKNMPCRMDTKRKILEALGLTPMDRVAVFGEEE